MLKNSLATHICVYPFNQDNVHNNFHIPKGLSNTWEKGTEVQHKGNDLLLLLLTFYSQRTATAWYSPPSLPSVRLSPVAQSCPALYDPVDCCILGLPVHHQLPEFIQTHVYCVSDAIQPSHCLLSPSPSAFNLS